MLLAIALLRLPDGRLRAVVPDLQNCDLLGATEQELLPKIRLAAENELTRLMLAGSNMPDPRDGRPMPGFQPGGAPGQPVRWLNLHINLAHLDALARHQAGR
jgi:hypothetical protein